VTICIASGMGQSSGKASIKDQRAITKKSGTADDNEEIYLDGYGSEKWEATPLADALTLSSNPGVASARYHVDGSRQLTDDYRVVGTTLGKGATGEVVLVKSKSDNQEHALKSFRKHQLSEQEMKHLTREVQICLAVDHPGIARLHDVYDTQNEMFLVMECCSGGELFDRLEERGQYTEQDAADATLQMLLALNYLHKHRIVHRDIKLENFLYESRADNAALKLIDFGFAKVWDPDTLMMARCGSIAYVSPDVLTGMGYTSQCDVWSLGVVVFMLLSGYPPFHGSEISLRAKIKGSPPNFSHKSRWKNVAGHAQDFVCKLLEKDPSIRPTAQTALQHPWLITKKRTATADVKLNREVLSSLRKYMRSSKVRRTTLQLLAQELLPDETSSLRQMFLQMDRNDTGTISLAELKEAIRGIREGPSSDRHTLDTSSSIATPAMSRASSQVIAELFDLLDANGDEQVYYSDFLAAAIQTRSRLRVEAVRKVFNRLDVDHSGTISASDLHQAIGENFADVSVEDLLRDFEVTLDGRGEVTFDAFLRMLERNDAVPVLQPIKDQCSSRLMMDRITVLTEAATLISL